MVGARGGEECRVLQPGKDFVSYFNDILCMVHLQAWTPGFGCIVQSMAAWGTEDLERFRGSGGKVGLAVLCTGPGPEHAKCVPKLAQ